MWCGKRRVADVLFLLSFLLLLLLPGGGKEEQASNRRDEESSLSAHGRCFRRIFPFLFPPEYNRLLSRSRARVCVCVCVYMCVAIPSKKPGILWVKNKQKKTGLDKEELDIFMEGKKGKYIYNLPLGCRGEKISLTPHPPPHLSLWYISASQKLTERQIKFSRPWATCRREMFQGKFSYILSRGTRRTYLGNFCCPFPSHWLISFFSV